MTYAWLLPYGQESSDRSRTIQSLLLLEKFSGAKCENVKSTPGYSFRSTVYTFFTETTQYFLASQMLVVLWQFILLIFLLTFEKLTDDSILRMRQHCVFYFHLYFRFQIVPYKIQRYSDPGVIFRQFCSRARFGHGLLNPFVRVSPVSSTGNRVLPCEST